MRVSFYCMYGCVPTKPCISSDSGVINVTSSCVLIKLKHNAPSCCDMHVSVCMFSLAGLSSTGSTDWMQIEYMCLVTECIFPPCSSVECSSVLFNPHTKVDPHAFDLAQIITRPAARGEKERSVLSRPTDPHTAGLSKPAVDSSICDDYDFVIIRGYSFLSSGDICELKPT